MSEQNDGGGSIEVSICQAPGEAEYFCRIVFDLAEPGRIVSRPERGLAAMNLPITVAERLRDLLTRALAAARAGGKDKVQH